MMAGRPVTGTEPMSPMERQLRLAVEAALGDHYEACDECYTKDLGPSLVDRIVAEAKNLGLLQVSWP